ncbi:MAG: SLBB domain-containing protein [Candidatus Kapabacteria bacterium]|nr:SLBB domain-containing protein [Candidatus Kapabacteria bacterium]
MVIVSPENTIMLERTGVLSVAGKTLQQLRDTLAMIMKGRSANVEIFLTIRRTRLVYVTLRGNVTYPGTYAVPASMRVSTFLTLMRQPWLLSKDGGLGEMARSGGVNAIPTKAQELTRSSGFVLGPYALRNVSIRHRNGTSTADLPKARVEGFSHLDPHVREGDEIIVPFEDREIRTISISGSVVTPMTLAYKQGDRVSLLLAAASGPTDDADLSRVILVQSTGGGKRAVTVDAKFRIVGEDVELEPGSTVIVERKVETGGNAKQGVVQVYGEVASPGSVVIVPGVTRLSTVLSSVGGINASASLGLSYVVRPDRGPATMTQQRDDAYRTFQYSDLKLEDTTRYQIDQRYRLPYVSCDMVVAMRDTNSADNIALYQGDIVVIQQTPDRVFVYGQVTRPGYVPFVPKKRLDWYVEHAGGFAIGAKEGRSRIVKGRSRVWVEDDTDVFVEPGDEIYVPRPPDIPVGTEIQTYAIIASIITSVVALTATMISILRK